MKPTISSFVSAALFFGLNFGGLTMGPCGGGGTDCGTAAPHAWQKFAAG